VKAHRVIPALLAAAGTAIPLAAGADVIIHSESGSASALPAAQSSVAAAPAATSTPSSPTATPTATHSSASQTAPTATKPAPTATPQTTARTYQGPAIQYQFGTVQATVTVTGKKITDVSVSINDSDPHSQDINSQAVPYLRQETLQAQSANVNIVSGATLTSQAYAQSLQAAMQQAGI
jgi:uncharacterized protein with FMN-binding domain